jgi:hypothetical protein
MGENSPLGLQSSPLRAKFTPRGKLHPWGQTMLLKIVLCVTSGRLFTSALLAELQKYPYLWTTFFHDKKCIFILSKNELGYILGDFFTNSSGHPDISLLLTYVYLFVGTCACMCVNMNFLDIFAIL